MGWTASEASHPQGPRNVILAQSLTTSHQPPDTDHQPPERVTAFLADCRTYRLCAIRGPPNAWTSVVQSLARVRWDAAPARRAWRRRDASTSRRVASPHDSRRHMRERLAPLAFIENAGRGTRTSDNPQRSS